MGVWSLIGKCIHTVVASINTESINQNSKFRKIDGSSLGLDTQPWINTIVT